MKLTNPLILMDIPRPKETKDYTVPKSIIFVYNRDGMKASVIFAYNSMKRYRGHILKTKGLILRKELIQTYLFMKRYYFT